MVFQADPPPKPFLAPSVGKAAGAAPLHAPDPLLLSPCGGREGLSTMAPETWRQPVGGALHRVAQVGGAYCHLCRKWC